MDRVYQHSDSQLVKSIRVMMEELPPLSPECCIYRVPKRIRDLNEEAYTPQLISIGPFHHHKPHLQAMGGRKLRYLQAFLERSENVGLEGCVRVMKEWEERIRNHYAERIEMSSDEFVKMILLDAAFIIEAMCRRILNEKQEQIEQYILFDVQRDMILLENQIPFSVLDHLFSLAFPSCKGSFLELSIAFFENMFLVEDVEMSKSCLLKVMEGSQPSTPSPDHQVKHFVDMLRMYHLPSSLRSPSDAAKGMNFLRISNATELQEAGMRFRKGSSYHLLDIQYNNCTKVLEIPGFRMTGWTEPVLRNIVALEQCHYGHDTYISDYVHFMDGVIDSAKDADLLVQNGIIRNELGDSSVVSRLFNNLTRETTIMDDRYFYHGVSQDLNAYCKDPWHKWKATLRRDYFSSPWIIASTVAAVILLLLTLIQAISSIISLT